MANEVTATAANDTIQTEATTQAFLDFGMDVAVAIPLFHYYGDLLAQNQNGPTLRVPYMSGAIPSANDNGAWGDTEYDASEGVALGNAALTTGSSTCTVGEYGYMVTVTDNIGEDSSIAGAFMTELDQTAAKVIFAAKEVDACALGAGLSNSVGSTGVNITVAQAVAMLDGVRARGYHSMLGGAFVWDDQTWADLRDLLIATGTSWQVYSGAADRFLGAAPTNDNGLAAGLVGVFLNQPCFVTGQTPTANAGADVVSMFLLPAGPGNERSATFGYVDKRPLRKETQRYIEGRGVKIVWSSRSGVFERIDGAGTKAVTDA